MARKLSFDTAIIKDIKSVAGDSFADNVKMLPIEQLQDNPENFYDLSDIDTLAEDIDRQGLKTPLYVVPDDDESYMIISGHRRKAAVQKLLDEGKYGSDKLPCYIGSRKSEAEITLDLIMLNATARVITDAETMKQCGRLEEVFKQLETEGKKIQGRMREKIAAALNVSPAQVGKVENIRHNAIDEVKAAVNEGKMSISTANEVAKLEPEKQKYLIEKKKPEEITSKEIKSSAAKEKAAPKKQREEVTEEYVEDTDEKSTSSVLYMPDTPHNSDDPLSEKEMEKVKATTTLWREPPEHFNDIVDSGMCNSIITGYILLVLEKLNVDYPKDVLHIINSVFDFYGAQEARDKFSNA